ncbi:MAG: glycerol-3-phosphate 1-O-acyltransferase PlsY [Desulfovibrio sp.]|jgi:glycerol-3-phosphate acyltransferase PlsY|nr:glycerol-3-phosphate 1-O-acyltransferase PlsY [Desulfovibrio sp.]
MTYFFSALFASAAAFTLGSIPFGLLIGKIFCGIDPRSAGSGNVGATNVARLCGTVWGALTLLCDVLKGLLPIFLYASFSGTSDSFVYCLGLASICGHVYSLFLGGKGGKGVATTVGVFLAFAPVQLAVAGLACLAVIWRSGFVSAGSITLVALMPLIFLCSGRWTDALFSLLVAALILHTHRENIRRLIRGEEKSWLKR